MIKWINIKKRRPVEPDIYLIAVNIEDESKIPANSVLTAVFNGNYFCDDRGMGIANVTHWTEVPDNPNDENEECSPWIPIPVNEATV